MQYYEQIGQDHFKKIPVEFKITASTLQPLRFVRGGTPWEATQGFEAEVTI